MGFIRNDTWSVNRVVEHDRNFGGIFDLIFKMQFGITISYVLFSDQSNWSAKFYVEKLVEFCKVTTY